MLAFPFLLLLVFPGLGYGADLFSAKTLCIPDWVSPARVSALDFGGDRPEVLLTESSASILYTSYELASLHETAS